MSNNLITITPERLKELAGDTEEVQKVIDDPVQKDVDVWLRAVDQLKELKEAHKTLLDKHIGIFGRCHSCGRGYH